MGKLSEQLKAFFDSEEGKALIQKENEHRAHVESINEKYIEKFHALPNEKKITLLYKLKEKSDNRKDASKGLYDLLWLYAEKYCRKVLCGFGDKGFERSYDILGAFVLKEYDALFYVDYGLFEIGDTVVPHEFPRHKFIVKRYGTPVFETHSEETLNDAIAQVFEKHLVGYSYESNNLEYQIHADGSVKLLKR